MDQRLLSVEQLHEILDDQDAIVVDTRNSQAYNGFLDHGCAGHLNNSIQFTIEWLDYIKDDLLGEFIIGKGIVKEKRIVIFDDSYDRTLVFYYLLRHKLKYDYVYMFNSVKDLYTKYPEMFIKYPYYQMLVSPSWVYELISGKMPETSKKDFRIFYCNSGINQKGFHDIKYRDLHIPSAYYMNVDELESFPLLDINEFEDVKKVLQAKGITNDMTIVLYADYYAAFRVWIILRWFGIEDVRVMDGGLRSWLRGKYPLEHGENENNHHSTLTQTQPLNKNWVIDTGKEIYKKQKEENLKLVSVRSWGEFSGKDYWYNRYPDIQNHMRTLGEPEGSIWGYSSKNMTGYLNPDGTLRNPEEVVRLLNKEGISKDDQVSFYCGTGWRANVPLFMTKMLGWENSSLYGGSWIEWEKDSSLPIKDFSKMGNLEEPNNFNNYGQY